jgi:hypothetical protein
MQKSRQRHIQLGTGNSVILNRTTGRNTHGSCIDGYNFKLEEHSTVSSLVIAYNLSYYEFPLLSLAFNSIPLLYRLIMVNKKLTGVV